ncbi:putative PAS sensor signal transduction histidine kinase [Methanocella conradii HZ254]|uniref:histidine kinase n=1 Tax=Methanocella conradii (strain DSM 24694 / JCM 17849 / CGMCC 1.5162 / HZ254) TaxID=1041930 RepID=H8I644_METCZ|nr:PAS domain S-box protein [Methanocella conradii]AFD00691.1 putative PAS sensor signal transduction histidine kinase [Methanocella conradii HZ254]
MAYRLCKPIVLGATILATVFMAFYINVILGIDIVYTHLFYIPIIIAGVWYHKKAVYLALFLGALHILINYMVDGPFTYNTFLRASMFLIVAYIVGTISEKKDMVYNSLETRVRERTAELSRINETLKGEMIEREHAEKALRESEEKFRILAESSPAAILLYRDSKLIYVNRTTELMVGLGREELLNMELTSFIHPAEREIVRQRAAARLRGEKVPGRYEVRVLTPDGREKWLEISSELISLEGKPTGLVSAIDVTERKKAEKALIKSRAILSRAQRIAHIGNWAWNLKTGEMQWSDEIFRIFGYEPGEIRPTCEWLMSRIHPEDREMMEKSVEVALKENRLFNIDYRIIASDGSIRYINCVADKLKRGPDGEPLWLYGIKQDITRRKKVEEELQDAKAQAELYLDLMGHDINNLNQIGLGFLEMALETLKLDENEMQLLSKPMEALKNSTQLISNVRKLQQAKGGNLLFHKLSLKEMLERLMPQYYNVAGRSITIDFRAECECSVYANDLLSDVFSNIIGNSIKHSSGPLTIGVLLKSETINGKRYCRVSIEDDGPGIQDEVKRQLFRHGRRAIKRGTGGLGLYLVMTLVEDFHGSVWVEDRVPGDYTKGCRFVVRLPAANN